MWAPGVCTKAIFCLLILGIFFGTIISCSQASSGPIIAKLETEFPAVKKGESTRIECTTTTGYSNGLTYAWTATGGSILGTGSIVVWTAPDVCGTYSVTVTVTDENDLESSRELSINVTEGG